MKLYKPLADTSREDQLPSSTKPPIGGPFKVYVICSMISFWTCYTLLVRHTRSTTPASEMYISTTVVFMAELLKLLVTLFVLFRGTKYSHSKFLKLLNKEFFEKPNELLKMSVPSITYALQNNLDIVALSNLDAGVYQVTAQGKIVTTAIFMMLFLKRSFALRQWIAIVLLFVGVAVVQLNKLEMHSTSTGGGTPPQNPMVGIIAVLSTCVTAGFAGVYFEMMLKDGSSTPFWVRNLQMYTCGLISSFFGCYLHDAEPIDRNGFFHGYNRYVHLIIFFLSIGGIYISLIMKYMDNLYKSFASSISIVTVVLFSVFLFDDTQLSASFLVGTVMVCAALLLYNSSSEESIVKREGSNSHGGNP